ncbi:hypothetical protein BDF22DRAFT_653945 [Syncephalis plumigaleata]|nr:hypothetical protein BDF22DRAFT_653945 [Syncephalis plumigaleata]
MHTITSYRLAMLNTPTVPYYPVEFTVYPDGKHSQERVLQRTVTVTRNNTGLTPTSYNSSLYVSATAYYDTAVTNSSIIALSPQPSLVHVAKTPALLDNDNDNGNSTEKPKHRTPQLMARQLQYEPAASLPPLKLRNRQSLKKSINQASKTKSAKSNDATLLGADLKKDTPQLVLSPSLTTARIAPLATQIKQILEAEEAYLKRLELVRDAYWKPLCLRYPMQGQWTTNSSNSSISSIAWSSTSDEDSEYESINDDNNDDNDSRLDESIMKDDTASVSTMLSSSTSTIATDDKDGITNDLNTFTDIQIDDILPATITDSSIKSKDTTTMPFQKCGTIT